MSTPEPGSDRETLAVARCRQCGVHLVAVTQPDGTVNVSPLQDPEVSPGPLESAATVETAFGLDEVVRIPYAIWQPRGDLIEAFEHRPEWQEALREALREAQAKPRPLSVPRRIFLSYRWGNEAEDRWVETLCHELEARGNHVVFDRKVQREENPPTVPELVARIADCHMVLAVLDAGYVERVAGDESAPIEEGWVTDEFHTAVAFAHNSVLTLLGLLRAGDRIPSEFRPFDQGKAGNLFDVREPDALAMVLDRFFVQFGTPPEGDAAERGALALHECRRAHKSGHSALALERANEACELLPNLADGFAQRARVTYEIGEPRTALADAKRAFEIDQTLDETLIYGAAAAGDLQDWTEEASLARLALERNRTQWNAHFLVAQALDGLDQVDAALAHYEVARRAGFRNVSFLNGGGTAWRRRGNPARALDWFTVALAMDPNNPRLLSNATAAAIEAERPTEAYTLLKQLADYDPQFESLPTLAAALTYMCETDGAPPVLIKRPERADPIAVVVCDACEANVELSQEKQVLCYGCGAVTPGLIEPCLCCGSPGKVMLGVAQALCLCPYCHSGTARRIS